MTEGQDDTLWKHERLATHIWMLALEKLDGLMMAADPDLESALSLLRVAEYARNQSFPPLEDDSFLM